MQVAGPGTVAMHSKMPCSPGMGRMLPHKGHAQVQPPRRVMGLKT